MKWTVDLSRDVTVTEGVTLTVEAKTAAEARKIAKQMAEDDDTDWQEQDRENGRITVEGVEPA